MQENFLDNVQIMYVYGSKVAIGDIYNDSKRRFEDGTTIRTSEIVYIDYESRKIVTQNTVYNF